MARVVSREHTRRTYDAAHPAVLRVEQGEEFVLEAPSVLRDGSDWLPTAYGDLVIPVTGPIAVEGARAGDTVRFDVVDIEIDDRGAMVTLPGFGAFPDLGVTGRIVEIRDGFARFTDDVQVPVVPMLGKIGMAVPGEAPPSSTVGDFGGNMDNKLLGIGCSIHLVAQVDEAHVYAGDLHACQADGESGMTALEVGGRVTLRARVVPALPTGLPVVVTPTATVVIGSGDSLDDAIREALTGMAAMLMAAHPWSRELTAMALSLIGDVGVCQLVNPRVSGKVSVDNSYLRTLGIGP